MLTPDAIAHMTKDYRSPQDTVAVWAGKAYLPSLEKCIADQGRNKVETTLKLYLMRLNVNTNAARPLTDGAIEAMVPIILDHILYDLEVTINTADLRIVFDRAMRGFYGKMYGGFGCNEICDWFTQYDREKKDAIDQFEERRKQEETFGRRSSTEDSEKTHSVLVEWMNNRKK